MKKAVAIILGILLCTSVFGNGNSEKQAQGNTKLKVGVLAAMTALPVVDIVEQGLDKKNGIEIELVQFTTGAPMNEAMAAGEIDADCIGAAGVFALANFNAKMVAEICNDTIAIELFARPDSPIVATKGYNHAYPEVYGTPESIKGKTVLCPAGTLSQYEVSKYLDVFGLTVDDVKYVPMEYGQAYSAFVTGEGDILATRSPQTYTASEDKGYVSIASLQNLRASATAQVVASERTVREKHEAINTLVRLVYERNDYLNNNLDYAADLMSRWFKTCGQNIDLEISKKQLAVKPFYGVQDAKERDFGSDFKNTLVSFNIQIGQLAESQRKTISDNVDPEFVSQFK